LASTLAFDLIQCPLGVNELVSREYGGIVTVLSFCRIGADTTPLAWGAAILNHALKPDGTNVFNRNRVYPHLVQRLGDPQPIRDMRARIVSLAGG